MLHNVFIALHAAAAVVCFAAGVLSLRLTGPQYGLFRVYLGTLLAMLAFVAVAIAVGWSGLDTTARLVFLGLLVLGLAMVWRAVDAGSRLRRQGPGWRSRYLDGVGFTLISLFDGFVIVAAIDLHAPVWLVILIGVAGVVVGIQAMKRVKVSLGA